MSEALRRFVAQTGRAAQLATASARSPAAQPGTYPDWSIDARSVLQWQALVTGSAPLGVITLAADGQLQIDLDDSPGWHPFIAMAGEASGRQFRVNARYRWDGGPVEDSEMATFDSTLGRYVRLATASDGSLASNGLRSRLVVVALDGQPWTVNDAWVGWVQSG